MFGKRRFEAPGPLQADKVVNIPPRSGMIEIADLLKREGVMDEHRLVFVGGVFALKARSELKSGEYLFPKRASVRDVVETMVEGKVVQHQITVPEGLTSEQIVARLLDSEILTGNIKDMPREGSLLPDSYHFHRGVTREQVIQRMQQAQERVVQEVWERRSPDLPLQDAEQLIILASIIEKETGRPEERTRVAAVFANRLKQKMRLQIGSDHHLRSGASARARSAARSRKSEIAQPTPYNTYVIDGVAARADRQSGPRLDRGRRQSGAHQGAVFRRRRHRRARVRRNLRSASEERRALARDRAGAAGRSEPPRTRRRQRRRRRARRPAAPRSKRSANGSPRAAGAAQ